MVPKDTSSEVDLPTSPSAEYPVIREADVPWPVPGDVLKNRYRLEQCVAAGPTTRLFRGRDTRPEATGQADSMVVLKVVTAAPGREPPALRALRREAALGHGLKHPNLPRILGLEEDGPHTFVRMAWLDGESLASILDARGARPMTRVQALHIIEGVGHALSFVHGRGITHADVKPANILVTAEGNATLLDFGVALGSGAGDGPAVRGYTPEYASPEVLDGALPVPADDLFSLACVAYRMLSGQRAFGSGTAREAAATGTRPPRPENLSPAQWRALDRALAFRRADRQPDVASFLAQIKAVRDEHPAVTDLSVGGPATAAPPVTGPERRPEILWPAVGALASALVVGAVYLGLKESTSRPLTERAAKPTTSPISRPRPPEPGLAGEAAAARVAVTPAPPVARELAPPMPMPARTGAKAPMPSPAEPRTGDLPRPATRRAEAGAASPPVAPASTLLPPARAAEPQPSRPLLVPTSLPASAGPATAASRGGDLARPVPTDPRAPPAQGGLGADTARATSTVPLSSLSVRRYVEPEFPRKAAARRVAGWVDVTFTVDASGRTRDVEVVNAEPAGVFDAAALAAVKRWRFESGGAGPDAGAVRSGVRLRFDPAKSGSSR